MNARPTRGASTREARYFAESMANGSHFERLGGESALHAVIARFVDRMFDDLMIGYLFRAADRERVKAKEYEFAARHLGAELPYTGRSIPDAHRPHRISGGHFMRRLQLLKDTLREHQVPDDITQHWVSHTLSLQAQVTNNALDQCDPERAPEAGRG